MRFSNYLSVLFIAFIVVIAIRCKKDQEKPDETPPVLSFTPIDISTVTSFIAFGDLLSPSQKNPAFEYRVNSSDVRVRSTCKGYIDRIILNDNFPDYEVWVKLSSASIWLIIYDHVLNLQVSLGDKVNAGDYIGTVGDGNRTELQVNKKMNNKEELSFCPFDFGTNDFIQQHKAFSENWCLEDSVVP